MMSKGKSSHNGLEMVNIKRKLVKQDRLMVQMATTLKHLTSDLQALRQELWEETRGYL